MYFSMFGAPFRSACNNLFYYFSKTEVHRIDIPATRLARGNHVGGLSFFSGSAAVAAGQLNSSTPEGLEACGSIEGYHSIIF